MTTKSKQLRRLADEVEKCTCCEALVSSRTLPVFGEGNPDAPLVFIGEAHGAKEDDQRKPFVVDGKAGRFLTKVMTDLKLRRGDDGDVYICKEEMPISANRPA